MVGPATPRYEYRVWGAHRSARKRLVKLATRSSRGRVKDCYLLVDDPSVNVKIRDNTLKIKQLVAEHNGFEQWARDHHPTADAAPTPFDEVFEQLRLDRPQRGKKYNIHREVARLDPGTGVRAVFVTKRRRTFRVGELRAEVTDIEIHETGEVLNSLSIEGGDLDQLTALRDLLHLDGEDNMAVHSALESELHS